MAETGKWLCPSLLPLGGSGAAIAFAAMTGDAWAALRIRLFGGGGDADESVVLELSLQKLSRGRVNIR